MPRGRVVDYLCQFLVFCPRDFDDQFREQLPEAIARYLDENRKCVPMITHQTPPFRHLPPLNLRLALTEIPGLLLAHHYGLTTPPG